MQITTGKNGGYWAAIRKNDVHEWIDTTTISVLPEEAYRKAIEENRQIPKREKINPVIRISHVEIREEPL